MRNPNQTHSTTDRPVAVSVIGWFFLVAGAVGVVYHATEFSAQGPFRRELVWVILVRLLAVIGAVFLLRARNWARWLLVAWLAYHVGLSAFHSLSEVVVHSVLLAVIGFFLFRPSASAYFASVKPDVAPGA